MKKLLFLIAFIPYVLGAEPLYPHKNTVIKNEFENLYKEIDRIKNKPAFFATAAVNSANSTGDGTTVDVEFDGEKYDTTGNFNTTTYTWTAPVTGEYHLSAGIEATGFSAHSSSSMTLVTTDFSIVDSNYETTTARKSYSISATVHMDAGDTAKVTYVASGGALQAEVQDDPGSTIHRNYFTGFLIN